MPSAPSKAAASSEEATKPEDFDRDFFEHKLWQYPAEQRSGWLPAGAREMVDNHPWSRRQLEKNPRFPGQLPGEALFCWSEADFASYISSGGFVKPKLQCQYYISPECRQSIIDLVEPVLSEMNWVCSVDTDVGRSEALTKVVDYMGMPLPQVKRAGDEEPSQGEAQTRVAPILVWEGSRRMIIHKATLKFGGLVNRIDGIDFFTKVGMLNLVRERCVERDIPINFPPAWYPLTFELPDDLENWKRHVEAKPHKKWIYKPTGEAMGRGIILINKISDVDSKDRPFRTRCKRVEVFDPSEPPLEERDFAPVGVIQEYMVNPMLLENRKFAVRVYLFIARVNPLLVFHYNYGYIKRCSEYYDENKFQRADLYRHITNQEFQKMQKDFYKTEAAEIMSIEGLDRHLEENNGIHAFRLNFWRQVKEVLMELCLGCKEAIQEKGRFGMFEIFGCDMVVDNNQQVYLLEANRDPSWVMDTAVKQALIPRMIREMFELTFWAHSDAGKGKEAMLSSPMDGFEVLLDDAFDFQAVDIE